MMTLKIGNQGNTGAMSCLIKGLFSLSALVRTIAHANNYFTNSVKIGVLFKWL